MPTIEKSIFSLLNKVSHQNKNQIVVNLTDLLKDIHAIDTFIDKLFDKCITESNFTELYVEIIYETLVSIRPQHPELAKDIYRSLIIRSQKEFEGNVNVDNRIDKVSCTRFIAQLTNRKFINPKLLHDIIIGLLSSNNQYKYELACILILEVDNDIIRSANRGDDFGAPLTQTEGVCKRIQFMMEDAKLNLFHQT